MNEDKRSLDVFLYIENLPMDVKKEKILLYLNVKQRYNIKFYWKKKQKNVE